MLGDGKDGAPTLSWSPVLSCAGPVAAAVQGFEGSKVWGC